MKLIQFSLGLWFPFVAYSKQNLQSRNPAPCFNCRKRDWIVYMQESSEALMSPIELVKSEMDPDRIEAMPQELLCKAPQQDNQAASDSMLDLIAGASGIRITQCEDGGVVCEFESGGVISISADGAIKRVSFANAPNLS